MNNTSLLPPSTHNSVTARPRAFACAAMLILLLAAAIAMGDWLARARDPEHRAMRAEQKMAAGDHLAAIRAHARLLRERETDIAARYALSAAYHNYGWHDEALANYDQVLRLANTHATRAAHSAARIHLQRNELDQALFYYETALRHQPDAADIRAEYEALRRLPQRY